VARPPVPGAPVTGRLRAAYRRTGADPPGADPRGAHGVPMEGYYWRLVTDAGEVVVALCGVVRSPEGRSSLVALASTGAGVAEARAPGGTADPVTLGVEVPGLVRASPSLLEVRAAPGEELALRLAGVPWPRRRVTGLGPAGAVPGLSQYWHPHTLGAPATGVLTRGGRARAVRGSVYAEKNWGPGFPTLWWWVQAHDRETLVALAGGRVEMGPLALTATSVVLRHGDLLLRLGLPTGLVRADVDGRRWHVRGWSGRDRVEIEGAPGAAPPARLPFPAAAAAGGGHVHQHLDGVVRVRWHRGRRLLLDRELRPAGLEYGVRAPGGATGPPRAA